MQRSRVAASHTPPDLAVQECRIDVVNLEVVVGGHGAEESDGLDLCYGCECIVVVDTFNLCVALRDPACVVANNNTVNVALDCVDPLGAGGLAAGGKVSDGVRVKRMESISSSIAAIHSGASGEAIAHK